jgi:hypothetical protein
MFSTTLYEIVAYRIIYLVDIYRFMYASISYVHTFCPFEIVILISNNIQDLVTLHAI